MPHMYHRTVQIRIEEPNMQCRSSAYFMQQGQRVCFCLTTESLNYPTACPTVGFLSFFVKSMRIVFAPWVSVWRAAPSLDASIYPGRFSIFISLYFTPIF